MLLYDIFCFIILVKKQLLRKNEQHKTLYPTSLTHFLNIIYPPKKCIKMLNQIFCFQDPKKFPNCQKNAGG